MFWSLLSDWEEAGMGFTSPVEERAAAASQLLCADVSLRWGMRGVRVGSS